MSKCKELGVKVFVDDDYFTVVDLVGNGIKGCGLMWSGIGICMGF